jgi:hypothetical protein
MKLLAASSLIVAASAQCDCSWTNGGYDCVVDDGAPCFFPCCRYPTAPSVTYCPDPAKDFWEEVEGPPGHVTWSSSGWLINGQRRVSSKASYDLRGGSIEWDMDLSNSHGGVNSNFYLTFPRKLNSGIGSYCDSGATGGCAELDLTENNGGCFQATTWDGYLGGTGGLSGGVVHMKATWDQRGNTLDVQIGNNHYSGVGEALNMDQFGAVIYSSQWVGWFPEGGGCGGDGNLQASSFSVSNLKIHGSVKQGPEPTRCTSTSRNGTESAVLVQI